MLYSLHLVVVEDQDRVSVNASERLIGRDVAHIFTLLSRVMLLLGLILCTRQTHLHSWLVELSTGSDVIFDLGGLVVERFLSLPDELEGERWFAVGHFRGM